MINNFGSKHRFNTSSGSSLIYIFSIPVRYHFRTKISSSVFCRRFVLKILKVYSPELSLFLGFRYTREHDDAWLKCSVFLIASAAVLLQIAFGLCMSRCVYLIIVTSLSLTAAVGSHRGLHTCDLFMEIGHDATKNSYLVLQSIHMVPKDKSYPYGPAFLTTACRVHATPWS
jgi:hypothetical protein